MKTKQLTIYAMLIALTVALSLTILIPVPATNGFVTLCEAGIYTAAFLYGPTGGLVVGASRPGNIFQNLIGMGLAFPITASLQRIQARKQY